MIDLGGGWGVCQRQREGKNKNVMDHYSDGSRGFEGLESANDETPKYTKENECMYIQSTVDIKSLQVETRYHTGRLKSDLA